VRPTLNTFKNTIQKIRSLLKEDDNLTKEQCEMFQWQLLVKVQDYSFSVGKGGVNTIFYSASSLDRRVCYPDEILELLDSLAKSDVFVYVATANNEELGYSVLLESAKAIPGAKSVVAVSHLGKRKRVAKKVKNMYGKRVWQST